MSPGDSLVAPYPYVSIGDLRELACAFDPTVTPEDVWPFEQELQIIKQEFAPGGSSFGYIGATALTAALDARVEQNVARSKETTGVVYLDRYIGVKNPNPHNFRLELSRNNQRKVISRPGALPVSEQLGRLDAWMARGAYDDILLVDDVLVSGRTAMTAVERIRAGLPYATCQLLVGVVAVTGQKDYRKELEKSGVAVESLVEVRTDKTTVDGSMAMALTVSRDFTLQGGKVAVDNSGRHLVYPYFLPFSAPMPTVTAHREYEAAQEFLTFNQGWTRFLENRLGKRLTIGDVTERGFGIPHTSIEELQGFMEIPGNEVMITDYIDYAADILHGQSRTPRI